MSKCVVTVKKLEEVQASSDEGEAKAMDFIQLPSDSEEDTRKAVKQKSNSNHYANYSQRKKFKM